MSDANRAPRLTAIRSIKTSICHGAAATVCRDNYRVSTVIFLLLRRCKNGTRREERRERERDNGGVWKAEARGRTRHKIRRYFACATLIPGKNGSSHKDTPHRRVDRYLRPLKSIPRQINYDNIALFVRSRCSLGTSTISPTVQGKNRSFLLL